MKTEPPSTLPAHAEKFLTYLRAVGGEILLDDQGVFRTWRETDLDELAIAAAADYLVATGAAERTGEVHYHVKLREVPK